MKSSLQRECTLISPRAEAICLKSRWMVGVGDGNRILHSGETKDLASPARLRKVCFAPLGHQLDCEWTAAGRVDSY
jgi:hypothetical protein